MSIPLRARRGTEAQLDTITLQAGEFGFTTDKEELWLGLATGKALVGRIKVGNGTGGRDAAGVQGRAFFDYSTNTLSVDDGAAWQDVGGSGGGSYLDWANYVTSSTTAAAGKGYHINSSGGALTITLPVSPSNGDVIGVVDAYGDAAAHNITIGRNGKKINNSTEDWIIDTDHTGFILSYNSTLGSWSVLTEIFSGDGGGGGGGTQGAQGNQGNQGPQGPQGWQGVGGTDGTQGPQGNQGWQGVAGAGTQGAQGWQGPAGTDGAAGADGTQGAQGWQGVAGGQGAQGWQGVDGTGTQGYQGVQGWQGADGSGGGLDWTNYTTSSVTATAGNGYHVNSSGGVITVTLPASPGNGDVIGVVDSYGDAAAHNITVARNGKKINNLAEDWIIDTDHTGFILAYNSTLGTWAVVSEIFAGDGGSGGSGTQGAQGAQGNQGWQGAGGDGSQGAQGVQGPQGYQGPQGNAGSAGAQGAQGWQGPAGVDGADGANGADGAQGPQGNQGWQGVGGADGADGADGVQGSQGAQGWQGNQGWQGAAAGSLDWDNTASSNFTAQAGKGYHIDTSSSSVTVTLPSSPSDGDVVGVADAKSNAGTNNIILSVSSGKINNRSTSYTLDADSKACILSYHSSFSSWAIVSFFDGFESATGSAAYYYGGRTSAAVIANADSYDGSSWTDETDVTSPARHYAGHFAVSNKVWWAGGTTNTSYSVYSADCDGYAGSAWTAGGDMISARYGQASFVLSSNGYSCYGKDSGGRITTCDYFNGTSWTNTTSGPSPVRSEACGYERGGYGHVLSGYNTAELSDNDYFSGSSWTSGTDVPTPARAGACAGTLSSTIYLCAGWTSSGTLVDCDAFDGSSWSAKTDLPTPNRGYAAAAVYNSLIYVGGGHTSSTYYSDLDAFNGSSWSSKTSMDLARAEEGAAAL